MSREQTACEANLVNHQETERQAKHSRGHRQIAGDALASTYEPECRSKAQGDHHHARDGAQSENQQIGNGPVRIPDGAEDEQGNRRRSRQAVNDADCQRP